MTKSQLNTIATLHATIAESSIFRIDGATIDLPAALIDLANAVHSLDHGDDDTEFIWHSVGDFTECPLGDLIVGAYWSLTEWHGGQYSDTYAALCALGRVFNPGRSGIAEDGSSEYSVYEMINTYLDELYNK